MVIGDTQLHFIQSEEDSLSTNLSLPSSLGSSPQSSPLSLSSEEFDIDCMSSLPLQSTSAIPNTSLALTGNMSGSHRTPAMMPSLRAKEAPKKFTGKYNEVKYFLE